MKSEKHNIKMLISNVRKELSRYIDHAYRSGAQRYIKEGIKLYGVRSHHVRKISAGYFSGIRKRTKQEIFNLCENLLESGMSEEKTIAFDWAYRLKNQYEEDDFTIFESWLKRYVTNWPACDDLCCHAFGCFVYEFPEFFHRIKT